MSSFQRNRAAGMPELGVFTSPGAPGIIAAPPEVSTSVRQADELLRALGSVGGIASHLGNSVLRQANRQVDDARTESRAMMGVGVRTAEERLPLALDAIAKSNEVLSPEEATARVEEIVPTITSGLDNVHALRGASERVKPALLSALLDRSRSLRAEASKASTAALLDGAIAIDSPESFETALESLAQVNPGAARDALRRTLQERRLDAAAALGKPEAIDSALSVIGDVPEDMVARARRASDQNRRADQIQRTQMFDNESASVVMAVDGGQLAPEEADLQLLQIQQKHGAGDEQVKRWRDEVAQARSQREKDAAKLSDLSAQQQIRSSYIADATQRVRKGALWMREATGEQYETTLSDGTTFTLNDAEMKKMDQRALDAEYDRVRTLGPQVAPTRVADMILRNKQAPTQLKALLNGADTLASIPRLIPDRLSNPTKAEPPSPALITAIREYTTLKQADGRAAAIAVTDDTARSFYEAVDLLTETGTYRRRENEAEDQYVSRLAVAAATALDRNAWNAIGSGRSEIGPATVATAVEAAASMWSTDISNASNRAEVVSVIQKRAEFFRALDGVTQEQAIARAISTFQEDHQPVRGVWMDLSRHGIDVGTMERATDALARRYVSQSVSIDPDGDGPEVTDPDELAVVPDGNGRWLLVRKNPMQILERDNVPGQTRFTTQELINLGRPAESNVRASPTSIAGAQNQMQDQRAQNRSLARLQSERQRLAAGGQAESNRLPTGSEIGARIAIIDAELARRTGGTP